MKDLSCSLCNPRPREDGSIPKTRTLPHRCWENFFNTKDPIQQEKLLISSSSWRKLNELRLELMEEKYTSGLSHEDHQWLLMLGKKRPSYVEKESPREWRDRQARRSS